MTEGRDRNAFFNVYFKLSPKSRTYILPKTSVCKQRFLNTLFKTFLSLADTIAICIVLCSRFFWDHKCLWSQEVLTKNFLHTMHLWRSPSLKLWSNLKYFTIAIILPHWLLGLCYSMWGQICRIYLRSKTSMP